MTELRIDAVARSLARALPRRRLIGALAAAVPAILVGGRPAAATCWKIGQSCQSPQACCRGGRCKNQHCVCQKHWTRCGGNRCVNLHTDEDNCGSCGTVCPGGRTCCQRCTDLQSDGLHCGACGTSCGLATCCNGACADLQSDPTNCGACGTTCDEAESCLLGSCAA